MSTKHYCDRCEQEMGSDDMRRLIVKGYANGHEFRLEVIHGTDGVTNSGHLCHDCILQMLQEDSDD